MSLELRLKNAGGMSGDAGANGGLGLDQVRLSLISEQLRQKLHMERSSGQVQADLQALTQ